MKKLIFRIITLALCLALTQGCGVKPPSLSDAPIKDTPVRVSESIMLASSVTSFSMEEAMEESDLVADVTIVSWLYEETSDERSCTFFKVKSNAVFKGEPLEEFVLKQTGSSASTFKDYPLFKIGDRLVLFLENVDERYGRLDFVIYDNTYNLIAEWAAVLHVEEVDGDSFVIDRSGPLTRVFQIRPPQNPEYFSDMDFDLMELNEEISERVIAVRDARDPVLAETNFNGYVFYYDDIIAAVEGGGRR